MIELVGNHLWQSTLFAVAAALLTLAFRHNRAQVRYWLWLAASVKFLVPFAALAAIGGQLGWPLSSSALVAQPEMTLVIEAVSQPFSQPALRAVSAVSSASDVATSVSTAIPFALGAIWLGGCAALVMVWGTRWRRFKATVREASIVRRGREVDTLRRLERHAHVKRPVGLVMSTRHVEPGVFGVVSPVLLWPHSIGERLADEQVEAILIHELCHVRRRDNLAAMLHMVVQALFWFHPLVWWVGARLVDERERACDEDVIRLGSSPEVYAESILKTCQFYVESPLVCVAGVTGSDLKKRIEGIMKNRAGTTLNSWKKVLLATAGILAIVGPIMTGALNASRLQGQAPASIEDKANYEVATVKPNKSGIPRITMTNRPGGGWDGINVTLGMLLRIAYQVQDFQVVGGPGWMYSDRFDVLFKAEPPPTGAAPAPNRFGLVLRTVLADRFNLKVHTETRELPVYALVMSRSDGRMGPQLRPSTVDCDALRAARGRGAAREGGGAPGQGLAIEGRAAVSEAGRGGGAAPREGGAPPLAPPQPGQRPQCGRMGGPGGMMYGGTTMSELAQSLSQTVGRVVLDKTGLAGGFDFDLKFALDPGQGRGDLPPAPPGINDRPADPDLPNIFTALQEQLGLKLESTKGPVQVLVIDRVEQPTEQ